MVDALGHSFEEGKCTVCGTADPDAQPPVDGEPTDPQPEEELNFFQVIINFFMMIIEMIKNLFKF